MSNLDTRTIRVLGTTRLSSDPEGRRANHAAQRRAINELVTREGWPAIDERDWFTDTDRSASKAGVERPGWQALLATVENIDARTTRVIVVAYAQDRLMRQLGDLQRVANLIERKRGELWTALQGQISVRKGGRVGYYVNGAVAADESERISARTTGGIAESAIGGKPHGPVGYGWTRVYEGTGRDRVSLNVVNDHEAEIVRELARRVLAGESLRRIALDLNERGVRAPGAGAVRRRDPVTKEPTAWAANKWEPQKVRQILLRKANIGVRVHTTGSGDDAQAAEYKATWDDLLDPATYAQVVAVLSSPERRVSRSNVARHLLSNIARCGVCKEPMTVQTIGKQAKRYAAYRCPVAHVAKTEAKTDAVVEQAVLEILASDAVRASLRRDDDGQTREAIEKAAGARETLLELEGDYLSGRVTRESWLRMSKKLNDQIAAAEAVLSRRRDNAVYADLVDADDIGAAWDATPIDRRRAIIAAVADVVLHRTSRRGRSAFDPESITVTPRIPDDAAAA